jgi:hypothetical protein
MAYIRSPYIQRLRKIGEIFRISRPSGLESNPVPQEQRHTYIVRERTRGVRENEVATVPKDLVPPHKIKVRNNRSGHDLHSSSTEFESRNGHLRCQAFKASFVVVYLNKLLWVPFRVFQVLDAWQLSLRILCRVAFATDIALLNLRSSRNRICMPVMSMCTCFVLEEVFAFVSPLNNLSLLNLIFTVSFLAVKYILWSFGGGGRITVYVNA